MLVRIAVAVVFVPLLLLAMLPSSPLIWSIVVAAIAAAASFELLRAAGEDKVSPWMTCVAVLSAALIPLGCWMGKGTTTVSVCTFVVMAVSFWCAIRAYDEGTAPIGFYHVMLTLFSGVLIPLGLSALVLLKRMDHGEYWVLFAVLMAFVTDAGAYFVGVFFGKHRGITKVSPNKSIAGFVGGLLTPALFGLLSAVLFPAVFTYSIVEGFFLGLLTAALAVVGDLIESSFKRSAEVKDSGTIIPGRGGILDSIDSIVMAAPVYVAILTVFLGL